LEIVSIQKIAEMAEVEEITQENAYKLSKMILRTEIQVISVFKGQEEEKNQRTQ
jgi:hypothetical protein